MKRARSDSIDHNNNCINTSNNNNNNNNNDNNDNITIHIHSTNSNHQFRKNSINNTTKHKGIVCNEPPCNNNFVLLEFYQSHVENMHDNRCNKCMQNFVSPYLLELHFNECHNPFATGFERLKCFEPQCYQDFDNHKQRISHLMNFHQYPPFYDFDVIFSGY